MAKVKDEWCVVLSGRNKWGDSVSCSVTIIPGFTSEKLAQTAMDASVMLCKQTHSSMYGTVVKVKEAPCLK